MRRYSVSALMGLVCACAVGLAALRSANELWAGILLLMTMALLGVATLGVINQRGPNRAWWLGFVIFAGGYLVITFGPWFSEQIQPKLVTTQLLGYVHLRVTSSSSVPRPSDLRALLSEHRDLSVKLEINKKRIRNQNDPALRATQRKLASLDGQIGAIQGFPSSLGLSAPGSVPSPPAPLNRWQAIVPGAANYDQFLRVGHCLLALLAGVGGAIISSRLYSSERISRPENV